MSCLPTHNVTTTLTLVLPLINHFKTSHKPIIF
jgi:hypothetical protein